MRPFFCLRLAPFSLRYPFPVFTPHTVPITYSTRTTLAQTVNFQSRFTNPHPPGGGSIAVLSGRALSQRHNPQTIKPSKGTRMNGAESLLETLIDSGVEVCFANPGTSEMQLVAAIDKIPGIRPILGLFEGVVTGAADGYGRMADKPAATLLHLGSGFSNGMANLHNAKRAFTPMVNIIGDHASYHLALDAPLTSDVPAHAAISSEWSRYCESANSLASTAAEAVAAASTGCLANIIVPADYAWTEGCEAAAPQEAAKPKALSPEQLDEVVQALESSQNSCLFLGGRALRHEGLVAASRIASASGSRVVSEVFPARIQRGKGRPNIERLPYLGEMAADSLKDLDLMICIGAKPPVSFFAYPGKPGTLWPEQCRIVNLADHGIDHTGVLEQLAERLAAGVYQAEASPPLPPIPEGALTAEAVGAVVANYLPANSVISDESNTSGVFSHHYYDGAENHDWMCLTGGAIGQGLPLALGAAVACPDRKVINLQADGSAMYTNQSLWTMARENLDVCVIIYNNSRYAILDLELARVGVDNPGEKAKSMLELTNPSLNWSQIATGMGVYAERIETTEAFKIAFQKAMSQSGPMLLEVML